MSTIRQETETMMNIINTIAESLDDTTGESISELNARRFSKPRRSNHSYFNSAAYIEVGLLDNRGNYSAEGTLYDLSNERELPESLHFLHSMLMNVKDYYGELILYFQAEMYKDEGDRDEYGQLMSPVENFDNRQITGAALKIDNKEIKIDDAYLDDLFSVFESDIQDAYVNTERE